MNRGMKKRGSVSGDDGDSGGAPYTKKLRRTLMEDFGAFLYMLE